MNFKVGDKVKVVSLVNTQAAFSLDSEGLMEAALNNIYTIEKINTRYNKESVYLNISDKYGNFYMWHKNDLQLVDSNELE